MAITRNLCEGWTLDDGVIRPFELERPMDIMSALAMQGEVEDIFQGMNCRAAQWTQGQTWRYRIRFEMPEEEDERAEIALYRTRGKGRLILNGHPLLEFEGGSPRVDVTAWVNREEENLLEVVFLPELLDGLVMERGLGDRVELRCTNYVTLYQAQMKGSIQGGAGTIDCEMEITAHAAGRYVFRYGLMLEDEPAGNFEFYEKLPAARSRVSHQIRLDPASAFEMGGARPAFYDVRLSIERSGVGCELIRRQVALETGAQWKRGVQVGRIADQRRVEEITEALHDLGAQAVCCDPERVAHGFEEARLEAGLMRAEAGTAFCPVRPAAMEVQKIERLAGGEKIWPMDGPVWRLRGGAVGAIEELAQSCSELGRTARVSRFLQAVELFSRAMRARRLDTPLMIQNFWQSFAYWVDDSLVEYDGQLRPACAALKRAWAPTGAWAELPETLVPGQTACLPLYLMAETGLGEPVTLHAAVYNMEGSLIAGSSYPVVADRAVKCGELALNLPNEAQILTLRLEVVSAQGQTLCKNDQFLVVFNGEGQSPLLNPKRALIKREQGALVNDSPVMAIGAAVSRGMKPLYWGALLPNEKISLEIGPETIVECLNAMV